MFKKLILLFLFFSLSFTIAFFYFLTEKKEVTLINFKGTTILEALEWIEANSLQAIISEKNDLNYPSYQVLAQNPAPGITVKEGRKITLIVNSDKINQRIPSFVGKEFGQARKEIFSLFSAYNYIPRIIRENKFSKEYPAGIVVEQNPLPDANVNQNQDIILITSKGIVTNELVVENYQFKNFRQVEKDLSALGIFVKATFNATADKTKVGTIFKQNKEPGEVLNPQDEIGFLVATDIEKINLNEATRILRTVRFKTPSTKEKQLTVALMVNDSLGTVKQLQDTFNSNQFVEIPYSTLGSGTLEIIINGENFKTVEF